MVLVFILLSLLSSVYSQDTWCGKNYRKGTPIIDPGGHYPLPPVVSEPRLLFRCSPAIKPYLQGDDEVAGVLIDLQLTNSVINGTYSMLEHIDEDARFLVKISTNSMPLLTAGILPLGVNQRLHFPLSALSARHQPYPISCTAQLVGKWLVRVFEASSSLSYLPPSPYGGSVVKMDIETKGLLVKKLDRWQAFVPFGFYTAFDSYLARNLSVLDAAVEKGYNLVHPIPTFGNLTALDEVLDHMEELGLWLMYDMRWSYKNETSVKEEVDRIKRRKNLLLWYTADEPDGWGDALNAPKRAYDQIYALDGYHPVSLVLNCEDYHFREYITGADIILQDTYPIGINASYSIVYDTPCTLDYGDCGCDNCVGDGVADVARRLDGLYNRLYWDGRKGMPVWTVVQSFGNETFWGRYPTGKEFIAQTFVSFIHGARGIVPWLEPTSDEIASFSSRVANALSVMQAFILDSQAKFNVPTTLPVGLEVATWTIGDHLLVLASSLTSETVTYALLEDVHLISILLAEGGEVKMVNGTREIVLTELSSIAFIVHLDANI